MIKLNFLEIAKPVTSVEIGDYVIRSTYQRDSRNSCKLAKKALKENPDEDVIILEHLNAPVVRLTVNDLKELRDGIDALITHLEDI